jgi:hypothetical protein
MEKDKAKPKQGIGSKEVDPKLVKIMMRVICGVVIAFAVGMLAFTFYAQNQLKDNSDGVLDSNYVYNR